ncbi:MAG: SiaB family protein kinase [Bacteroidales bacterium]
MQEKEIASQISTHLIEAKRSLIAYEGPFFIDLLTIFGNYLKIMTENNSLIQKKLFKIYVELSQNVAYYAEEYITIESESKRIGIGELRITEDLDQFQLMTKNLVKIKDANLLSQRCDIINNSSLEELKGLKRELRKSSESNKLGARIGLVQARLISNNHLDFDIIEKDRYYSYFKLTIKFDKNE